MPNLLRTLTTATIIILVYIFTAVGSTQSLSEREKGVALYNQKNYSAAIVPLQIAVKLDEHDVIAWYYLGLTYAQLTQKESSSESFEKAAKIHPEDYFESLRKDDQGKFEQRLLEIRPMLVAAANSAVHFQSLNSQLAGSKKQEWVDRLAELYEFATIAVTTELTKTARITERPKLPVIHKSGNARLIGELSILVILRADGVVKGVTTFGYVPRELQNDYFKATSGMKFEPAIKDGKPMSQLALINFKTNPR